MKSVRVLLTSSVSNLRITSKLNLHGVQKVVYGVQCMSNDLLAFASSKTYETNSWNIGYFSGRLGDS